MRAKNILIAVIVLLAVGLVLANSGTRADDQDQGTAFDQRLKCMTHCNDAYGGLEWIRPGQGQYQGWANCMLRCDREYWDSFDKETKDDK